MQPHYHPLDAEELELLDAIETGELHSLATPELLDQLRQAAYAIGECKDEHRA